MSESGRNINALAMTRRFYDFVVSLFHAHPRPEKVSQVLKDLYEAHWASRHDARSRIRAAVRRTDISPTEESAACAAQFRAQEGDADKPRPRDPYPEPPSATFLASIWAHANASSLARQRRAELLTIRAKSGPRLSIDHTYRFARHAARLVEPAPAVSNCQPLFGNAWEQTVVTLEVQWPGKYYGELTFEINGVRFIADCRLRTKSSRASDTRTAWYRATVPPLRLSDRAIPLADRKFAIRVFRGATASRVHQVFFAYLNKNECPISVDGLIQAGSSAAVSAVREPPALPPPLSTTLLSTAPVGPTLAPPVPPSVGPRHRCSRGRRPYPSASRRRRPSRCWRCCR